MGGGVEKGKYEGCGGIPTPCNGVSGFGVSDSPCNTSTMNEWGVNLHYVKVGLYRRVRGD